MKEVIEWTRHGSPRAKVENVEIFWRNVEKTHNEFGIK